MSEASLAAGRLRSFGKLAAIDAVRGYAVLLVIIVHTAAAMPELPWPVKKLTNFGWYGVQLFFVASAITLLISWYRSGTESYGVRVQSFLARRFWRIAPMYYTAACIYLFLRPPGEAFSYEQLAASLAFFNSWHPQWMPVTGGWQVVPGGWSIGVEFSFYLLFPLLVGLGSSLVRALGFAFVSAVMMLFAHTLATTVFPGLENEPLSNFAYYWLPNQLAVFALGFVGYALISSSDVRLMCIRAWLGQRIVIVSTGILFFCFLMVQLGTTKVVHSEFPWLPTHWLATVVFTLGVVGLIENPSRWFVHPLICNLGKYSFSAYCLHFGVIDIVGRVTVYEWSRASGGVPGIAFFVLFLGAVLVMTYVVSRAAFVWVESPFIKFSHVARRTVQARSAA